MNVWKQQQCDLLHVWTDYTQVSKENNYPFSLTLGVQLVTKTNHGLLMCVVQHVLWILEFGQMEQDMLYHLLFLKFGGKLKSMFVIIIFV